MAYRDIVESLAARLAMLEGQVGERTRERDEVARLLAEARAKARDEAWVAAAPVRARRWRRGLIAIAVASVVVAAIGAVVFVHARRARPSQLEAVIHGIESYADEMCTCTDTACTQHVTDDMMTWAKQYQPDVSPPPELTPVEQARLQLAATQLTSCMQRAMQPRS